MTAATTPVRRLVRAKVPHGVKSALIVTIYPDATVGIREHRRPARTEQRLAVGELYVGALRSAVARTANRITRLRRTGLSLAEARRIARQENAL